MEKGEEENFRLEKKNSLVEKENWKYSQVLDDCWPPPLTLSKK